MGIYIIPPSELYSPFLNFLQTQEGEVCAQTIVECWNEIAKEFEWNDMLQVVNKNKKVNRYVQIPERKNNK